MKTIDTTPTWIDIVPVLIAGLQSDNFASQKMAEQELQRMAKLADAYVNRQKEVEEAIDNPTQSQ